jgi:nicotinate-nucleotide adenylyltransferase
VNQRIGLLGGTFDPVHCGHLGAAVAVRDVLGLDRVLLVPSAVPPHRSVSPVASAYHRFAMVALAINGIERLEASEIELVEPAPSYTAETLERLHARGIGRSQIFFITGVDAFAEIATWRRYPEVLDLANFAVVSRPGYPLDMLRDRVPELAARMRDARTFDAADRKPSILLIDAATTDVSSSAVRERLRRGEPLTGLVPAAVEAHIRQHHLYRSGDGDAARAPQADGLHGES